MRAVETVDYAELVHRMAAAGMDGMDVVLNDQLSRLQSPKTKNEQRYFWTALFNQARHNDTVWLWLCTQPHIRGYAPAGAEFHTSGQFVENMPLPEIGGLDDEPVEPVNLPKQWPAEPTEENLRQQADDLDAHLRAEGEKNPSNRCKSAADYVGTFKDSGTGQMQAQTQLTEGGWHALATSEGVGWLIQQYA